MNQSASPYKGKPVTEWKKITQDLIAKFPLKKSEIVEAVQAANTDLYTSSFGKAKLIVGKDIFLPAQATGVILERLIALELNRRDQDWRSGNRNIEKDVVCISKPEFSFEIKTSSSRNSVYGNRSTGHRAEGRQKFRTGYYLVINYKLPTEADPANKLRSIRFGWIDDEDWTGQAQPTGQQASISRDVALNKLETLFSSDTSE
jgi:hypothetical protein